MLITLSSLAERIDPIEAAPEFKLKDLIAQSEDTGNAQRFGEPMKRKNNKIKKKKEVAAPEFSGESDNNNADNDKIVDDMSRFD